MFPSFYDPCIQWQATAFGAQAILPARQRWPQTFFLGLWLCGWAVGEVLGLSTLLSGAGAPGGDGGFLWLWLVIWTVGGFTVASTVAWALVGRETVRVENGALTVAKKVGRLGPTRTYALTEVQELRLEEPEAPAWWQRRHQPSVWGMKRGTLAFDYRGQTLYFGEGLSAADAETLLEALLRTLPAASSWYFTAVEVR